jgi:hypothetical protein
MAEHEGEKPQVADIERNKFLVQIHQAGGSQTSGMITLIPLGGIVKTQM